MRPIILLAGLALFVTIIFPTITAQPLADADAYADAKAAAFAKSFAGIFEDTFNTLGKTVVYKT